MRKFLVTIIIIALVSFPKIRAQEDTDSVKSGYVNKIAGFAEEVIDMVTFEKGRRTLSFYPLAGYSPRTGFEVGIMPVLRIKPKKRVNNKYYRPTTIAASAEISTKGMYELDLDVLAFTKKRWMFITKFQYLFLPDEFYGIGNMKKTPPFTNYDINRFLLKSDILKGLSDRLFVGFRLDFNYDDFSNIEGDLLNHTVVGYNGGWANGIGPGFAFDSRDDQLYPSKGWFVLFSTAVYGEFIKSDYNFTSSTLDIRKFISLKGDKSIIGFQGAVRARTGDVPFYMLASIGGKRLLRGIPHPYRYLDKHSWYMQAEWRKHIWWRIGGVLFAGTGKVSSEFFQSPFNELHFVSGGGVRFRIMPDEGLNFRADIGVSNNGDKGIYFTIREAF